MIGGSTAFGCRNKKQTGSIVQKRWIGRLFQHLCWSSSMVKSSFIIQFSARDYAAKNRTCAGYSSYWYIARSDVGDIYKYAHSKYKPRYIYMPSNCSLGYSLSFIVSVLNILTMEVIFTGYMEVESAFSTYYQNLQASAKARIWLHQYLKLRMTPMNISTHMWRIVFRLQVKLDITTEYCRWSKCII